METGLFLLRRGDPAAWESLHAACILLKEVLLDHHPMALAVLMAILCRFEARSARDVAMVVLKHACGLAKSLHVIPKSFSDVLSSLMKGDKFSDRAALSILAVRNSLRTNSTSHWKTLYVDERYCDCLYNTGQMGEMSAIRAELLAQQETLYGPSARNVLWTLQNVAYDHLNLMHFDKAMSHFQLAIERSEQLEGFHRAKIRFAALEGLALTSRARVQSQHLHLTMPQKQDFLQQALKHIEQAIQIATTWFDKPSRRTDRAMDRRQEILVEGIALGLSLLSESPDS
jgi:hypothetical protein